MHALSMVQVSFCFAVVLIAGLFLRSFDRLSHQPLGYSPAQILNLESVARRPRLPVYWEQIADRLRTIRGVESVALAAWPLMSGETANSAISTRGVVSNVFADRFMVSDGWFREMKIPLLSGRDFRVGEGVDLDRPLSTRHLVKQFFANPTPLGESFDMIDGPGAPVRIQVVALLWMLYIAIQSPHPYSADLLRPLPGPTARRWRSAASRSRNIRRSYKARRRSSQPRRISSQRGDARAPKFAFRIFGHKTKSFNQKLSANRPALYLAAFFAVVAVVLAAVGSCAFSDFRPVLQQRRDIGIRIALGAQNWHIIQEVTSATFAVAASCMVLGYAAGVLSVQYIQSILYRASAADPAIFLIPFLIIAAAAVGAAAPAFVRAQRINPVEMLRGD